MDPFTHIVVGAAVGEVVAGDRVGNRAMLWGAVGCTIPDFDVVFAALGDPVTALSFHRGFTHSYLFALLAPWAVALVVEQFYHHNIHQHRGYKRAIMVSLILFYLGIAAGINFVPYVLGRQISWLVLLPTLALGAWLARLLWRDYWRKELGTVEAPYMTWVQLFFWTILAHIVVDCFTDYGTQVGLPFTEYRVQWTTIAVIDPLLTLPFAAFLLLALSLPRQSRARDLANWAGILWGTLYLVFTYWHKQQVDAILAESLQARRIPFERITTGPTLFNNIVWQGLAESDTAYYYGLYGFNDRQRAFTRLSVVPKNHHLLSAIPENDRSYAFVRWFTSGFYNALPYNGDTIQVNNLRYGLTSDTLQADNYVYSFLLYPGEDGRWGLRQLSRNREKMLENDRAFTDLWRRIIGSD
jgi:inner membrane protein